MEWLQELLAQLDDLTRQQLVDAIARTETEDAELVANGDKNAKNTRILRALRAGRRQFAETLAEIDALADEPVEAPAEPTVEAPAEPVAEAPAEPVAEAPAPITEAEVAGADIDAIVAAAVETAVAERVAAELATRLDPTVLPSGSGATSVESDPAAAGDETPATTIGAIYANLNGFAWDGKGAIATSDPLESPASLGQSISAALNAGIADGHRSVTNRLFRRDAFAGLEDLPRMGDNADDNARIAAAGALEPVMASLGCCAPEVAPAGGVCANADRPIASMFSNRAGIGCGKVRWHRPWSIDALGTPAGGTVWTQTDQSAIDPTDRTTWKPFATLPGCDDICEASAYWIYGALEVQVSDETSRPNRVTDAQTLVDVDVARKSEQMLLQIIDFYADPYAIDLCTEYQGTNRAGDNVSYGIGAVIPAIVSRIQRIMTMALRYRVEGAWTVVVPEFFVLDVSADIALAGGPEGMGEQLVRDVFRRAGITNVVITQDSGCEGDDLITSIGAEPEATCELVIPLDCDDYAFGYGADIPAVEGDVRLRFLNESNYTFGQTGVIDYAIRRDTDLISQNAAMWQGETAEMLFKSGACGRDFTIDISGYAVNGGRPTAGLSPFGTCPVVEEGGGE